MHGVVDRLRSFHPTIAEILAISGSPGLSLGVLHHGDVIHNAHFGRRDTSEPSPLNDDTIYHVASLMKVMTAGVVGSLVDDGIPSWDVPIRGYFPAFGQRLDKLGRKATLRDLLANRTGLAVAHAMWG